MHCVENSKQIFPEMKVRGLVPNFYTHESVSDLYISTISRLLCCIAFVDQSWENINRSQIHECGNWECRRAVSFLGIFVSKFLVQCICSVSPTHTVDPKTRWIGSKRTSRLCGRWISVPNKKIYLNCWCRTALFLTNSTAGKGRTGERFLLNGDQELNL